MGLSKVAATSPELHLAADKDRQSTRKGDPPPGPPAGGGGRLGGVAMQIGIPRRPEDPIMALGLFAGVDRSIFENAIARLANTANDTVEIYARSSWISDMRSRFRFRVHPGGG